MNQPTDSKRGWARATGANARLNNFGLLVAFGGFIAMAAGSFGPWATREDFSASGLDRDGLATLVSAGVALVALAVYLVTGRNRALDFTGGPIGAATVICFMEIRRLGGTPADVGWGLWLVVAGIILAGAGLTLTEVARRKRTGPSATAPTESSG